MGVDGGGGEGLALPMVSAAFGDALRAIHGPLVSPDSRKTCRAGSKIINSKELAANYLEG